METPPRAGLALSLTPQPTPVAFNGRLLGGGGGLRRLPFSLLANLAASAAATTLGGFAASILPSLLAQDGGS